MTNRSIELEAALRLALEALKAMQMYAAAEKKGLRICDEAIIAAEEALMSVPDGAQPSVSVEQEPVATLDDLEQEIYENTRQFVSRDVMEWMLKRYYTAPPPVPLAHKRPSRSDITWVGLTKKEVHDLFYPDFEIFHQRIEAKLKAKNFAWEKNTRNGGCL